MEDWKKGRKLIKKETIIKKKERKNKERKIGEKKGKL